jgi:hypothetical protein
MDRFHRWLGFLTLAAFLGTGQYMRHLLDLDSLSLAEHFFNRSRHIYILGVAMVNLALSVGVSLSPNGWRRGLQLFASGLLAISSILMVAGFFLESPRLDPGQWDRMGLYAMLGGTLGHVFAAWRPPIDHQVRR